MKVYKATRPDMTCTMGIGTFQYELGKTYTAEECKCGKTGLHSCEYILGCMSYYPLGKAGNRFFLAEASGDIHEIGGDDTRVSSTELKLVKELDPLNICYEAMSYMINHPERSWKVQGTCLEVKEKSVDVGGRGWIGIARGYEPRAIGYDGAVIGLLHEEEGEIRKAKIITIDGQTYFPGVLYELSQDGQMMMIMECDQHGRKL